MTAAAVEFDGFYQAHFRETVAMAFGFTGDMAAAQDIAQEAFSRAWQRWSAVSRYDNPVYWVRRVATNLAHSRWRRLQVAAIYLVKQRPEEVPDLSPDSVDVVNALKKLPPSQRKAIVLYYLADMPVGDVAAELEVPVNTVKSWLHRGREALSVQLSVDIERVVTVEPAEEIRRKAGRSHARRRAAIVAAAVVLLVLAGTAFLRLGGNIVPVPPATPSPSVTPSPQVIPQAPAFPAVCTPSPLPTPAGLESRHSAVTGGDPTGQYLIGHLSNREVLIAGLIWQGGQVKATIPAEPGTTFSLRAINRNGVAIGNSWSGEGDARQRQAWVYADGERKILKGKNTWAIAISGSGEMVGYMDGKPVVWRSPTAAPDFLALPAGFASGMAFGITDEGAIYGSGGSGGEPRTNVLLIWEPNGSARQLLPPGGVSMGDYASVYGDWAVVHTGTGELLWNVKTGANFQQGQNLHAALNSHGWYVTRSSDGRVSRGTLQDGTNSLLLPNSLPGGQEMSSEVKFIGDNGQLLAGTLETFSPQWTQQAVVWTCRAR